MRFYYAYDPKPVVVKSKNGVQSIFSVARAFPNREELNSWLDSQICSRAISSELKGIDFVRCHYCARSGNYDNPPFVPVEEWRTHRKQEH